MGDELHLTGFRVKVRPHSIKFSVVLYIRSSEAKNIPFSDFYIVSVQGKTVPAVAHRVNKNCLFLSFPSKKKCVKELKKELWKKLGEDLEAVIYPLPKAEPS